ncbi:folliculin [Ostrinia nubilalis]|uniref:folliculin n=1 Tax=Ostrinia nubilalis TaxID=29057 RepID=UPI0030823B61
MNAIIGLCHFCEAHGPRPLFCTFTTDDENHTKESSKSTVECTGCSSLGSETILVSRDDDGTIFCSRESVVNADVTTFLRQAAIRSITCEVSWSKEGGVVYFSDTQGHVLSLTFQLKDTRARGLKRWFSIVVLMKDKMLLLNLMPVLSEHMQKISKELQDSAETVYNNEQKICSQRALRLKTGRNDFGQSRSLKQLTGDEEVFKRLHSHFTWMLKAGALTYSETLYTSHDLLNKLNPQMVKNSIFDTKVCEIPSEENCIDLRALENMLSKSVFRILLYCTLMGINIEIKPNIEEASIITKGLKRCVPIDVETPNVRNVNQKIPAKDKRSVCILEKTDNSNYCCNWSGSLPSKCPTIMIRIENAMENSSFNDAVLHQHIKSLLLEWLGTAKAVKSAIESSGPKSEAVANLKKVFGLSPQDDLLISYWISAYC